MRNMILAVALAGGVSMSTTEASAQVFCPQYGYGYSSGFNSFGYNYSPGFYSQPVFPTYGYTNINRGFYYPRSSFYLNTWRQPRVWGGSRFIGRRGFNRGFNRGGFNLRIGW